VISYFFIVGRFNKWNICSDLCVILLQWPFSCHHSQVYRWITVIVATLLSFFWFNLQCLKKTLYHLYRTAEDAFFVFQSGAVVAILCTYTAVANTGGAIWGNWPQFSGTASIFSIGPSACSRFVFWCVWPSRKENQY